MSTLVKLGIVAAAVAALIAGVATWRHSLLAQGRAEQRVVDQAAADGLKRDAAAALSREVSRAEAGAKALEAVTQQLEVSREAEQTANRAAVRARAAGPRLQFTTTQAGGCGSGGGSAATAPSGAASDASPTTVVVPPEIAGRLWDLAGDAESLAIDYRTLKAWAENPAMTCTLPQAQ